MLFFLAVGEIAQRLAGLAFPNDIRLAQVVFRPAMLLLLLAGYSGMLKVFDRNRRPLPAMGLPGGWQALRHSLAGILLGAAAVFLTVAITAIFGDLSVTANVAGRGWLWVLLVEVFLVLSTGAMMEEVAFRGYPFQRLVESVGAPIAVTVFAMLFGAIHLGNPHASPIGFINTVLIGVVFCVAYLRTRALWLPWGIHWAWNVVLGVVVGLPVSGMDMSVGIHSRASGPDWLTGGAYGPEASVACTAAVLAGLVAILLVFREAPPSSSPEIPADVTSDGGIRSV